LRFAIGHLLPTRMLRPAGPPYDPGMHWLDRASAAALRRLPRRKLVFRDGWGDRDRIDAYLGRVATLPSIPDPPIERSAEQRSDGRIRYDLTFESPAEDLPDASRPARVTVITADPEPERIVILMSQWNDHEAAARIRLAGMLLEHGIASAIMENPYYGRRRPVAGDEQPISTVADFGAMGRAAVLEGRVLARHFFDQGYRVGVSGYSMGGNLAGFVAAGVPFPIAAAPLAAAHSPGPVFLDGVLRSTIAWEALGGDDPGTARALRRYLSAATVLDHPPARHLRAAVLVAATKDGYVPTSAVQAVHRHWPGSKMEWVNGGHGWLLWRRKDRLVGGILESFRRLEELEAGGEAA
jgi:hypothetical protein